MAEPRRPMWKTPSGITALTGVATVLVSVIALIASLGGNNGGERLSGDLGSLGGTSSAGGGGTPTGPRPDFATLVYSDALVASTSGFDTFETVECEGAFEGGYRIAALVPDDGMGPLFCRSRTHAPVLTRLASLRAEVTSRWLDFPEGEDESLGHGAIGLACYSSGGASDGSHYVGFVTTNGTWRIVRQDGSDMTTTTLEQGRRSDGWSATPGQLIRIRIDCWGAQGGVNVDLWVDGQILGSTFDREALPATGISLFVWGFAPGRADVLFQDLDVYTPGAT
jgi:hypothetical protein